MLEVVESMSSELTMRSDPTRFLTEVHRRVASPYDVVGIGTTGLEVTLSKKRYPDLYPCSESGFPRHLVR